MEGCLAKWYTELSKNKKKYNKKKSKYERRAKKQHTATPFEQDKQPPPQAFIS